jgi:hypothetical protein
VPVTAQTVLKALKLAGPITDVTTTPNPAGRVGQLKLATPATTFTVPATQLRAAIGLRSTWFTVGLLSLTPPQPAAPVAYGAKVPLTSIVRGFTGVTLEQKPNGGDWSPVRTLASTSGSVQVAPTITTDYRLATTTVAAGSVRIKVAPALTLTSATANGVTGTEQPVLMGVTVSLQQQSPDLTWATLGTAPVAADGTYTIPATLPLGATVRVVTAATDGYASGTSASQIVSG